MKFNKKSYKKINDYYRINFIPSPNNNRKKVFYGVNELCGWRFYLKALLNLDFRSIIKYLRRS